MRADSGIRRARREIGLQATLNVGASAIGGVYLVWLVAFLLRNSGAEQFGIWATATAVLAPLSVLDAGLSYIVIRSTAARAAGDEEAERDTRSASSLYAFLGLTALACGAAIAILPGVILKLQGGALALSVGISLILALDYALLLGTSAWGGILRGLRRYDSVFAASAAQAIVGVAGTVLAVGLFGLIGAALAQLAAHAVGRAVQVVALRSAAPWFHVVPGRPAFSYLKRVMGFAAPLLVISIAGQLSFSADVVIVGAFSGAVAATWVTVGARLPGLALSLAHLAADVMFPFYVEEAHVQKPADSSALHRGLELAGFLGGAAFVALLLARQVLLQVWVGDANPVALAVMSLYCLAWLVHMPAHILTLLLIARGRHGALVPVIVIEALANLGLSIALVQVMGPVGVAVASLAAVAVSNVILIPILAHRATGISLTVAIWNAGRGWLLGALAAVSAYLIAEAAPSSAAFGLGIQVTMTAALSAAWLWFVWRAPTSSRVTA